MPKLDSNVSISCTVQFEELVCPSGVLTLQLPNRSIIENVISSSATKIALKICGISLEDFGKYYCNISVTSPQFPNVGLRAFESINLQGK